MDGRHPRGGNRARGQNPAYRPAHPHHERAPARPRSRAPRSYPGRTRPARGPVMSDARFRMTRLAADEAADSRSLTELAERLTHDPRAHYAGAVPSEVGAVTQGV